MQTTTIKPDFQRFNPYPTPDAFRVYRTGIMPKPDADRLHDKIRREAPTENNPGGLAVKGIPRVIIYADQILTTAEAAHPNTPYIYAQIQYAGLTIFFTR